METIVQGTPEWFAVRLGKVTASRVADVIARTKTGWGASRANYAAELVAERLTGEAAEKYSNAAMQWGTECEPSARAAYEFRHGADVTQIGFIAHPSITMSGASPDGLVGEDGLIEIKCPNTATHIDTLLGQEVPSKYVTQMLWQMACTGRQWCDFISYDPRLPPQMRLFVKRVMRDEARIAELEQAVIQFLAEVDRTVQQLGAIYDRQPEPEPEPAVAESEEEGRRRRFHEMNPAAQIAMSCSSPSFREYLRGQRSRMLPDDKDACDKWLKGYLGVESKTEVVPGSSAFGLWTELRGAYEVWLKYERAA